MAEIHTKEWKDLSSLKKNNISSIFCPVSVMTAGSMFAHRDIIESDFYQTSARCITESVSTLRCTAKDFKKLFDDTFSFRHFILSLTKKNCSNYKDRLESKEKRGVEWIKKVKSQKVPNGPITPTSSQPDIEVDLNSSKL